MLLLIRQQVSSVVAYFSFSVGVVAMIVPHGDLSLSKPWQRRKPDKDISTWAVQKCIQDYLVEKKTRDASAVFAPLVAVLSWEASPSKAVASIVSARSFSKLF